MYSRSVSTPGGPNTGPVAGFIPMVLMELNPYCRWTVNIATRRMTIIGMLASATKAPMNIANPVTSSVNVVSQAMKCGKGTPTHVRTAANLPGPRLSFAQPWAMNPNPMTTRNGSGAQSRINVSSKESDLAGILVFLKFRDSAVRQKTPL